MVTKTKDDTGETTDPPTDPPADDTGDEGAGHTPTREEIVAIVTDVVTDILGDVKGPAAEGDGQSAGGGSAPPAGRTVARQETDMQDAVEKAMARLQEKEQTQSRITALEEKVQEAVPRVYKRLTRMMWGSGD